jgi:hypothetical protein
MINHAALIARLCEASEGSAELSAEVWTAVTGNRHVVMLDDSTIYEWTETENGSGPFGWVPCLTTNLSAAWEEAERRGLRPSVMARAEGCKPPYFADVINASGRQWSAFGNTPAIALCAAMLAAEGER